MFWQNKNPKTPRRRDPSGARLMATTLGSLRSYLSKSNQSPLNIVHITRSMWYFAGIWYWLPTKPMSPRICCRRAQKCDSQQTLAARLHWWCNCKPWWKLGIEHLAVRITKAQDDPGVKDVQLESMDGPIKDGEVAEPSYIDPPDRRGDLADAAT